MTAPLVPGHCFVTGATGFIGAALVERLRASGIVVRGLSRSASLPDGLVTADLTAGPFDPRWLDGIDTVYHLAAKTHDMTDVGDDDTAYVRINVEGTRHLLEAACQAGVRRVVLVSSVKAVEESGNDARDESAEPRPTTAYGRSKLAAEQLLFDRASARGFAAVCLRFPLVYGRGQRGNLTRMIAAVDRGRFPPPPQNQNRRSMLHVENAVDALLAAGKRPEAAGQTYFVTDAQPYSTRQLYDWIREALGKPPIRWSVPLWVFGGLAAVGDLGRAVLRRRIGFDTEAFEKLLGSAAYSPAKIVRELGYTPSRSLHTTMPELVASYRTERAQRL